MLIHKQAEHKHGHKAKWADHMVADALHSFHVSIKRLRHHDLLSHNSENAAGLSSVGSCPYACVAGRAHIGKMFGQILK